MKIPDHRKLVGTLREILKDPLFIHYWDDERRFHYGTRGQNNQLHERIYGGYTNKPYYLRSDTHMLIEDVHTGVMPYLHRRRTDADPSCVFSPPIDSALERMIAEGVSSRERAWDLTDACCEFIRETTQQLMAYGNVYYELVYEVEGGAIKSFSLDSIPTRYLYKFFGYYYQIIPWWVARRVRTRVAIIRIPKHKVLRINFPKKLGGKRGLLKRLARLYKITAELFPAFTLDSIRERVETGFDSNEFRKHRYLEVARLTEPFGWNQRTRRNEYFTEHYFFSRYLDSEMARVIFRETILQELNEYLNSPLLNFGATIKMEGFTTREQINEWRQRMQKGDLKFIDMFNDLKDK